MRPRDFEIMLSIRIVYDPNEFFVETYAFDKSLGDTVGFTCPDILALAPDTSSPQWCFMLENKFDSKEGRFEQKASQCATYEARARSQFGSIEFA